MRRYSEKIIDGLERIQFFNQRAGRELWNHKPSDIQVQDIALTDKILTEAIARIRSCEETIEQLERDVLSARHVHNPQGKWDLIVSRQSEFEWGADAHCSLCDFTKRKIWRGFFPFETDGFARETTERYAKKVKLPNYCEQCGAYLQETAPTCGPDYCEIGGDDE